MDEGEAYAFLAAGNGSDEPLGADSLCGRCVELLGVDGAAVALLGPGRRETLCVSSPEVQIVEEWQFTFDDGPCVAAYRSVEPRFGTTGYGSPWPRLAAKAAELGFSGMAGFPLTVRGAPWGALDLYQSSSTTFDKAWLDEARVVAGAASNVVLDRLPLDPTSLDLVTDRSEVHQATGMISSRLDVSLPDALDILRARAISDNRLVILVARDVVAGRTRFEE